MKRRRRDEEEPVLGVSGVTWALTIALVVALLALDLVLAATRPHRVGFREATAPALPRRPVP